MEESRKGYILKGLIVLGLVSGTVAFAFLDLEISRSLYNADSGFGHFFKVAGDLPMYAFLPLLASVLFWRLYRRDVCSLSLKSKNKHRALILATLLLVLVLSLVFSDRIIKYSSLRGWQQMAALPLLTCLIAILSLLAFYRVSPTALDRWLAILIVAVTFALVSNLIVQCLKMLWGRARFRSLAPPDYTGFTPWFKPNGYTGNASFPSGHTTSACGFMVVPWIAASFRLKKPLRVLLSICSAFFIVSTALSRIILGAHFASDTLASIIICLSVFLASRRLLTPLLKAKGLLS